MAKRLSLNEIHVFKKTPGGQQFVLSEIHPAMRIGQGENSLYIQDGQVFSAGGDPIKPTDIPAWFLEEVKKVNPKALVECGYGYSPEQVKKRKPAEAKTKGD